jgi:hypothetical protein
LQKNQFDWKTNNCGLFVGRMLEFLYKKNFVRDFIGKCLDEKTSFKLIEEKGGWHNVLTSAGFVKRQDKTLFPGDVVISENAIGISDGFNGFFAGGKLRSKNQITDVYFYLEK